MWSDGIFYPVYFVVVVQQPSRVQLFTTAARQASLSLTISQSLPKFMFIALVMPSRHLIIWCPLLFLHSIFPSIGTFPTSRLFASDDQNTGASASASVLPVNIQGWSPLRLTSLISLLSRGLSGVFSSTEVQRHQNSLAFCLLYGPTRTVIRDHWEDPSLDIRTFVGRVLSLLFNTLSRFVIAFLSEAIVLWFHGCSHHLQWF